MAENGIIAFGMAVMVLEPFNYTIEVGSSLTVSTQRMSVVNTASILKKKVIWDFV
jgi:hypothetical protein